LGTPIFAARHLSDMAEHLWDLFLRPFTSTPDKEALVLSEGNFTYGQLGQAALSISTQLKAACPSCP